MKPHWPRCQQLELRMESWYGLLGRHRTALTMILLLMAGVFSLFSMRIDWQSSVLLFFSGNSSAVRDVAASQHEMGLVNRMRLDVHLAGPADPAKLACAVHALADGLEATGDFRWVWAGAQLRQLPAARRHLAELGPALLSARQLHTLERRAEPKFIQSRFAAVARRLARPDGELLAAELVHDPLNMQGLLRRALRALSPIAGAHFSDGLLLSRDDIHAMLVLAPNFPPANTQASIKMIRQLHQVVAAVRRRFPSLGVWAVGSYPHYADNARSIRRNVTWLSLLGTLLVAGAILLFFRRWSTLLICMLPPIVGLGTALGLAGIFAVHLPLLVLGFAGLLCGSTTDYGIQLLAALNRRAAEAGQWHPRVAAGAARELFGAISMSVCTSATGYAALALCSAPGLRELGLFIAGATLCIWLVTFLVLPGYFGPWLVKPAPAPASTATIARNISRVSRPLFYAGAAGFLILCVWMGGGASAVSYNHHPRGLDDITARTRADESHFSAVWGNVRHHGVVLIKEKFAAKALLRLREVTGMLAEFQRDHLIAHFYSPANLLPNSALIQRRIAAWRAFWTPARRKRIRRDIARAAAANGMNAAAWNPWLAALAAAPRAVPAAVRIAQSPAILPPGLSRQSSAGTTLGIAVIENQQLPQRMRGDWVGELRLRYPNLSIIDGDVLLFNATDRAEYQTERLFPWIFLLILLPLWLYFRRIDLAALACLSMLVGFVWLLGAAEKFCGGLNLMSMVPILFTMGVAVDYGIYAAGDPRQQRPDGSADRRSATMLCALTTISGTGVLAVSDQPVLRWIGITLVCGIAGGYFTSLFLVGPITGWIFRRRPRPWNVIFAFANRGVRAALVTAVAAIAMVPIGQILMARERPAHPAPEPTEKLRQTGSQTWRVGSAWMRRRRGIWELDIGGSAAQMGYEESLLGAPIDLRIENEMLVRMHLLLPRLWARWILLHAVALNMLRLPVYVPGPIQREIWAESLAHVDEHAYLAPTYSRLLAYDALHDITQNLIDNPLIDQNAVGCTGVAALPNYSGDGHLWLARNFDFEGGEAFNRQKSVTYVRPAHGYAFATVAWPGLVGCVTGMNNQKIGLFMNAAASRYFRAIGEPTIIVAREVLQHAANLRQAIAIFRQARVFVNDIIVVGDGKTGRAVIIEKTPGPTEVRWVHNFAAVANEFLSPQLLRDPVNQGRIANGTTSFRLRRAATLIAALKGRVNQHTLSHLLRDKKSPGGRNIGLGNRNAIDALITTHSVIMDLTAGRIWVAAWPYADGQYVGANAYKILRAAPQAALAMNFSHLTMPAGRLMTDGGWRRFQKTMAALTAGYPLLYHKHFRAALRLSAVALANDPRYFESHELDGRARMGLGQWHRALAQLQIALHLDPPYAGRRAMIAGDIAICERHTQ